MPAASSAEQVTDAAGSGSGHSLPTTAETPILVVGMNEIGSGHSPNQAPRVVGNVRRLKKGWIEYRNPHPESGKTRWRIDRQWHFACGQDECPHNGVQNHKHGTHRKDVPSMSEENYVNWKSARVAARAERRERRKQPGTIRRVPVDAA